jgi:hypothetical protein
MHYVRLIKLSIFMQLLGIHRKYYTKNGYFLSIHYFLQFIYYRNRD